MEPPQKSAERRTVCAVKWREEAEKALIDTISGVPNTNVAKNIIVFVGDGMSLSTSTAARIYKGEKLLQKEPANTKLEWENFPYTALIKTHALDSIVPDCASTATALLCGVKAKVGTLGLSDTARFGVCHTTTGSKTPSVLQWAQESGKSTGFVTTSKVTSPTVGALYAHVVDKNWESDVNIPDDSTACKDIARQLMEDVPGKDINVILGGGSAQFYPTVKSDENSVLGVRNDKKNLVENWLLDKKSSNKTTAIVGNTEELNAVNERITDYLLGLFGESELPFELERDRRLKGTPSLAEMTIKAINMLKKNPEGFFLLVESSKLDNAHHENWARHALEETLELDKALKEALRMTSYMDTLILVTADHSQVLNINGYPQKNESILGIGGTSDVDDLFYTILSYGSGPGNILNDENGIRTNIMDLNIVHEAYRQSSAIPLNKSTHSAEDVPLYAYGPMEHLFRGVKEQFFIPHAVAYASCIGGRSSHCEWKRQMSQPQGQKLFLTSDSEIMFSSARLLLTCVFLLIFHIT